MDTGNRFYKQTEGPWICLELSRSALERLGIKTVFEEAKPVGDIAVDESHKSWIFPHIHGGIPGHIAGVVTNVFAINRADHGTFLSIDGLTL